MSRLYTLNTLLRQMPRKILQSYFHHRGLLPGWNFTTVKRNDVETLLEALEELEPRERAMVEADFRAIFRLADSAGVQLMLVEAAVVGVDLSELFVQMANNYHCSMWLFLNEEQGGVNLFARCSAIAQVDEHSFTEARRLKGLPNREPHHDLATLNELAEALKDFYRSQGRGNRCKVEYLRRDSPTRHCFLAWPEDYCTSELRYEGDDLLPALHQPVLEVAFVYHPDEGVLEVSAPANLRDITRLQDVFCQIALDMSRRPSDAAQNAFALNGLKHRSFGFPTEPEDGIARVEIMAMKLAPPGEASRRLIFERDPQAAGSIHEWMDKTVGDAPTSVDTLEVVSARLRVTWISEEGRAPRTLTFALRAPDSSTLRDEPQHLLLKRYLKRWQLAV